MSWTSGPEGMQNSQSAHSKATAEALLQESLLKPGVQEALAQAHHEHHEHSRLVRAWRWTRAGGRR